MSVPQDVLAQFQELARDVVVHGEVAGIDDTYNNGKCWIKILAQNLGSQHFEQSSIFFISVFSFFYFQYDQLA